MKQILQALPPICALLGTSSALRTGMARVVLEEPAWHFVTMTMVLPTVVIVVTWAIDSGLLGPPVNKTPLGMVMPFCLLALLTALFATGIAIGLIAGHPSPARPVWWQINIMITMTSASFVLSGFAIFDAAEARVKQALMRAWWTMAVGIPWGAVLLLEVAG